MQPLCFVFGSNFLGQNVRENFSDSRKKRASQGIRQGLWAKSCRKFLVTGGISIGLCTKMELCLILLNWQEKY